MRVSRRTCLAGAMALPAAGAAATIALRRRSRLGPSSAREYVTNDARIVESNGLPGHATGDFPNAHEEKHEEKRTCNVPDCAHKVPAALGRR